MGIFSSFEHIVRDHEPLAPYTWFRLGGQADYFAEPTSVDELSALVRRSAEHDMPVRILGGGSNLLVRDEGVRGLVIRLSAGAFSAIRVDGRAVTAGGGAKLGHVISTTVREGLAGLEELVGIPGTVGGALHGNAGSHGSDVGQWTKSASVMSRTGDISTRRKEDLRFAYRQSSLDELVTLEVQFELEQEDAREITKRLQKLWILKKASQPLADQNMGCIFKSPGGVSAASLIEQAGMKGIRAGDADVSERDANFIIAGRGATSRDVLQLIEQLRRGVAEKLGVELETQIEVW